MEILTAFPASLIAGDTTTVVRTYDAHGVSVGDGWTVRLTLLSLNSERVTVTATESGTAFQFVLTATESVKLPAGYTSLAVTATKDDTRYTVEEGALTVKPDPTNALSGQASEMAHVDRVIRACQDKLEGKVTDDVQMYQLPDGVTVSKLTLREVRELLAQYKAKRARLLHGGRPRIREMWYALR